MSRIIEFRKSAQKAEKQSVQGKTCAFTGHRPQSLPFGFDESDKRCTSLKSVMRDQIVALIENEGVTHFITGMALGVDMYAAEIVLDLKSKYPHITLESAIPCETQAIKWSVASRERYWLINDFIHDSHFQQFFCCYLHQICRFWCTFTIFPKNRCKSFR